MLPEHVTDVSGDRAVLMLGRTGDCEVVLAVDSDREK
jgi:hypothetical protein